MRRSPFFVPGARGAQVEVPYVRTRSGNVGYSIRIVSFPGHRHSCPDKRVDRGCEKVPFVCRHSLGLSSFL
jgi:hypothetical protein